MCGADTHVQSEEDSRAWVIRQALALLSSIHTALRASSDPNCIKELLYNSKSRRIIDALLDLISLEGIYPNLLPGVGVPIERRVKSVLQGGVTLRSADVKSSSAGSESLLSEIIGQLKSIALDSGQGLCSILLDRTLVDLIAAMGQLVFSPFATQFQTRSSDFDLLLQGYASPSCMGTVFRLCGPFTCPPWKYTELFKS